ncbi:uncharacterized protein N7469_002048 [Penicillium citrinum]|uniref:DDE-1 domain-containing protein n=1 Tax=Penicillium citrinum TaxID=5077 RepID=A0A9W9TTB4_PENCI|nr:uncharacterized protein N7469_002048 [Penicillium citrinum]KAJ5240457.1 hypothetical protein N7469_002048 [Penicillium citrinum]
MPESYEIIEARIAEACKTYTEREDAKVADLHREFKVPYQRLYRRINAARCLLRRNLPPDGSTQVSLSKSWVRRFIKRLPPDINEVKQKTLPAKRKKAANPQEIELCYINGDEDTLAISPQHIYNFDETGFILGETKNQTVLTTEDTAPYTTTAESRELVTVIECANARGDVLPPYIIFNAKIQMDNWYRENFPDNWEIDISNTGYSNDTIAMEYLRHFLIHTAEWTPKDQPRLLLLGGHGSHLTIDFLTTCDENNIIPFALPSHTSNYLQPLDQQVFHAYKHHFRKLNTEITSYGGPIELKVDLLRELPIIRDRTFKRRTIRDSFKSTGIYPFNPSLIVDPIWKAWREAPIPHIPSPSPEILSSDLEINTPPTTVRTLTRSIRKIDKKLVNHELSPSLRRQIDLLFHANIRHAQTSMQLTSDLQRFKYEQNKRNPHRNSQRQIPVKGRLSVYHGKRYVAARDHQEIYTKLKKTMRDAPPPEIPYREGGV